MDSPNSSSDQSWRGCSLEEIHRFLNEFELEHVEPVRPSQTHAVLHHYPIREPEDKPPRPLKSHLKWDALHVRLPCSAKSQYPVSAPDGTSTIESRWEMIEQALLQPINSSHELQAAILTYNSKYEGQWTFRALHRLFEEELDESETRIFFEDLLPRIIRLALQLPALVQAPIPLLKQGESHSITLTQEQISCLLANAFLCTFPRRNTLKRKSEYSTFPDINFNRLFQSSGQSVLEKIKCICHYFKRVCPTECDNSNVPTGVMTFTRRSLVAADMPRWAECPAPLGATSLHINSEGTIEDQGMGLLQVDFANKYLGGGVLGSGCVQEEIRFVICPELLISKLFTEFLRPTEALVMVGCERYSDYTGYASTFQWAGNHEDNTPCDTCRRRLTHIVAIDALSFVQSGHQYREELMLRELNKAYVGFLHPLVTPAPGVASGNWGCGAFGGEATLKALLQLMVCTVTKRPLVYYTFGNEELRDEVHRMHTFFREQKVLVKDLWATLKAFQAQRLAPTELYNFIYSCHLKKEQRSPNSRKTQQTIGTSMKSKTAGHTKSSQASGATDKEKNSPQSMNVSQDIFASSSSEAENELDAPINIAATTSVNNSQASSTTRILISDDSEMDALLLAAADDALPTEGAPKPEGSTREASRAKTPTTPSCSRSRQRTLLEMLDQSYHKDNAVATAGPATKRHCLDKATTKS